jgi:acetoacetate decarboxylase
MEIGLNYYEMILSIPVEFNGKKGDYAALMYLDNVTAITAGREIWGFPKYFAKISFRKDSSSVIANIYKDEQLLVYAHLKLGNIINNFKMPDPLYYILKYIPSAEEGFVDIKRLNSVYSSNMSFNKLQTGQATLTMNSLPDISVGKIPVIKIMNAAYFESNYMLGFGKTEYDYLEKK